MPKSKSSSSSGRAMMDFALFARFGIPVLPYKMVRTSAQAVAAAARIGYPVALKLVSGQVVHKTERKAISLNLLTPDGVRLEFNRLSKLVPPSQMDGILVQQFAPARIELIVGGRMDAQFGPVILFGMGGIYTEVLRDTALRVCPIDAAEAVRMIRSLRSYPVLAGLRGQTKVDEKQLVQVLLCVSKLMVSAKPKELDINPLLVTKKGLFAADARVIR